MALRVAIRGFESEITRTLMWYRSSSRVILLKLECDTARVRVWCRSGSRVLALVHTLNCDVALNLYRMYIHIISFSTMLFSYKAMNL